MKDTRSIKRNNVQLVKAVLHSLKEGTKLEVANASGLSVATCNTILNELEDGGEVFSREVQSVQVGRKAKVYRLNYNHSYFLCLYFAEDKGRKNLYYAVLNLKGEILMEKSEIRECLDVPALKEIIKDCLKKYERIACISIGVPGGVRDGVLGHCDIKELENTPLAVRLQEAFGIPVIINHDMHVIAYGLYKEEMAGDDTTVCVLLFPEGVRPGVGTVVNGTIITGTTNFAGEIGFLPFRNGKGYLPKEWKQSGFFVPMAAECIVSLIALVNPSKMILTGSLVDKSAIPRMKEVCLEYIPAEHLPEIWYEEDVRAYFLEGLFSMAKEYRLETGTYQ